MADLYPDTTIFSTKDKVVPEMDEQEKYAFARGGYSVTPKKTLGIGAALVAALALIFVFHFGGRN
ncbi:MAG: hypothetical protein DDT22_00860 [candidate division WS2 bacterium]|nr:hypothetical protein [Candidatus Lithacetigena glycinireducens]